MAPDHRGEVSDVVVADIHAVRPDLADGLLHVDGIPMHNGIESEAKGAKLLFLPLLKRTSDFAAFAVMDTPAEAMAQFSMVELGQDAPPERRIVNVMKNMDGLGCRSAVKDKTVFPENSMAASAVKLRMCLLK